MLRVCGVRRRISFLTDVEGDFSYFLRFAENSKVVEWRNDAIIFRDSTSHFVYGGDVFDHGEDLRFARALLSFHDANPTRVHFVLGNRDINKMVLGAPTQKVLASMPTPEEVQCRLFPLSARNQNRQWLGYNDYLKFKKVPMVTSKETLVQWVLAHKLGSPATFEGRRKEMQRLRGTVAAGLSRSSGENNNGNARGDFNGAIVTDGEVVENFLREARPGGVYHEYLRRGKIAVVLDGVLFVHGGVDEGNVGFVPDRDLFAENDPVRGHAMLHERRPAEEWFNELNEYKEEAFKEWAAGGDGMLLRQYAFPLIISPFSVTVGSLVRDEGPRYSALNVVEYLNRSGVTVICSGHQPSGDSPCIVQQPGLLSIAADNSYCGEGGSRGKSVVEVLIEDDGGVYIHGRRADGTPYEFAAGDPLVGRHLGDGWWIKLKMGDDRYEAQRTFDGFRSREMEILRTDDVKNRLSEWHEPVVEGEPAEWWTREQLAARPRVVKIKRVRGNPPEPAPGGTLHIAKQRNREE